MKLQPLSILTGMFGSRNVIGQFTNAVLRELSDTGCVLFTVSSSSAELVRVAGGAARVELPVTPGEFKTAAERTALWLSPRAWLIQCRIEQEGTLVSSLNDAFQDKVAHAVPFTDALCWFELSGTAALDYLTEGCFISLEPRGLSVGHCKRTLMAQIAAVVTRTGQNSWQVAVERSRASYFLEWLTAAAAQGTKQD